MNRKRKMPEHKIKWRKPNEDHHPAKEKPEKRTTQDKEKQIPLQCFNIVAGYELVCP